jgi:hypothetical protein
MARWRIQEERSVPLLKAPSPFSRAHRCRKGVHYQEKDGVSRDGLKNPRTGIRRTGVKPEIETLRGNLPMEIINLSYVNDAEPPIRVLYVQEAMDRNCLGEGGGIYPPKNSHEQCQSQGGTAGTWASSRGLFMRRNQKCGEGRKRVVIATIQK